MEKEQLEAEVTPKEVTKESVIERIEEALNIKFSKEQIQAITHIGTPLNILSCAGSGKTTTLVGRMLFMEMYHDISPAKILTITFNKEAITDMENRYYIARKKLGLNSRLKITFKTYHALYYLILNSKFTDTSWEHLGGYTKYLKQLEKVMRNTIRSYDDDTLETLMSIRGYQVNNLLSLEDLKRSPKFLTASVPFEGYNEVIKEYTRLKANDNRIDFDDLQVLMYKEIQKNPHVLDIIHNAWEYIVVDEYQDISKIQLEILKEMVKDHNKLTAIGDDDQCIYEFRGSRTEYIVDFMVHFKNATRIVMDTNYRVASNILMPVTKSIRHNTKRVQKNMNAFVEGGTLVYTPTEGAYDSAIKITKALKEIKEDGGNLEEAVILVRNNSQQRIILNHLLHNDIPVSTQSNFSLEGHLVVRDIKAIIELALHENDYYFFGKAYRKIMPSISYKQGLHIQETMQDKQISWRDVLLEWSNSEAVLAASNMLDRVATMVREGATLLELINVIQPVYRNHLKFLTTSRNVNPYDLGDALQYMKLLGEDMTYEKFYKEFGRKDSLKRFYETNTEGSVKISTMHKMKGLEYKYVFLLDLTEDILPDATAAERIRNDYGEQSELEYIEQERRLFYVAWTRAKHYLNVMVNTRNPSRFILETLEETASNS